MQRLRTFAEQLTAALREVFVRFTRRAAEVQLVSTSQHFASQVTGETDAAAAADFALAFGPSADQPVGALVLPAQTARQWTQWLLGGVDSGQEAAELSALERSLLGDVAKAVVEVLKADGSGLSIVPAPELFAGRWPVAWDSMEELFKIDFSVKRPDLPDLTEASFVLPCSLLAGLAGRTGQAAGPASGAGASERIMQCLQDLDVTVAARFGTVDLSFHDILGLAVDDVVVLDQSPEHPVDVLVRGRLAFRGVPGQHHGGLAVLITEAVSPAS
jgi:flagellar motor switch protein FliM